MIHSAVKSGNVELVELLIQRGADANSIFRGDSALHAAIKFRQPKCVILLVNRGANVNVYNAKLKTPLYKAVKKSTFGVIEHLIRNGADVKSTNGPKKETPLHVACEKGFLKTAILLIDHGAKINVCTTSYCSPLSKAVHNKQEEIIQVLFERGAGIEGFGDSSIILHAAAKNGHFSIVKRALESGVNVSVRNQAGYPAIHYAVAYGEYRIVKLLLDWGENVDATNDETELTPLLLAAVTGRYEIVKLLIDRGASVNYQSSQGWAAIHLAAKKGCLKSVKYLLLNGSKVGFHVLPGANKTPLFIAAGGGHIDVCLAILDHDPVMISSQCVLFDHSLYSHLLVKDSIDIARNLFYERDSDFKDIEWERFDKVVVKVVVKLISRKNPFHGNMKTTLESLKS